MVVVAALAAIRYIGVRYSVQSFADALDLRWQQYELAVRIWLTSPLTGYGAGNYMHGAKLYGNEFTELLPVHNVSLWIARRYRRGRRAGLPWRARRRVAGATGG